MFLFHVRQFRPSLSLPPTLYLATCRIAIATAGSSTLRHTLIPCSAAISASLLQRYPLKKEKSVLTDVVLPTSKYAGSATACLTNKLFFLPYVWTDVHKRFARFKHLIYDAKSHGTRNKSFSHDQSDNKGTYPFGQ